MRTLPFPILIISAVVTLGIAATVMQALSLPQTAANRSGTEAVHRFVDFFFGVLTLMALSASVTLGLLAAERTLLTPRHRVIVQAVHRAVSTAAVVTLVIHVANKVAEGHAAPIAAVVPFPGNNTRFIVSVGTIAAELLVLTALTGMLRGRFAHNPRLTRLWRPMHWFAYASWPLALAHGLEAGRPAKAWVIWSYGINMAAVALILLIKFLYGAGRNTTGMNANRRLMAVDLPTPGADVPQPSEPVAAPGTSSALLALDVELPEAAPPVPTPAPAPEPAPATLAAPAPPAQQGYGGLWDTGEVHALLDAGQQQYLAEQAAMRQQQPHQQYQAPYTAMPPPVQASWDTGELHALLDAGPQQYLQQQTQQMQHPQQQYMQQYQAQAFPAQPPVTVQYGGAPYGQPSPYSGGPYSGGPLAADPFTTGAMPQVPGAGVPYQQPQAQPQPQPQPQPPVYPGYPADPWQSR